MNSGRGSRRKMRGLFDANLLFKYKSAYFTLYKLICGKTLLNHFYIGCRLMATINLRIPLKMEQ